MESGGGGGKFWKVGALKFGFSFDSHRLQVVRELSAGGYETLSSGH